MAPLLGCNPSPVVLDQVTLQTDGPSIQTARSALVESIRGTSVVIPDLRELISQWPKGTHPELQKFEEDIQKRHERVFASSEDSGLLWSMQNSQLALFGAMWWPNVRYEALYTATCLCVWLFAWDDQTDSQQFSPLIKDFTRASQFRDETVRYLRATLSGSSSEILDGISINPIITNFREVGDAIRTYYDERRVNAFFDDLDFFVDMAKEEHEQQMTDHLPTVDTFLRRRMGTSGVDACLAVLEYSLGIEVPMEIIQSEEMQIIHLETNMIISITNDILSTKKEVAQSQVDTLVPLLYVQLGSVQLAVDRAVGMIRESVRKFEEAEKKLLVKYPNSGLESDLGLAVHRYIEGCKIYCTGNLNWSLTSGRYKLDGKVTDDGILVRL